MLRAMKRIWQAARDRVTRRSGAAQAQSASVVAEPTPVMEPEPAPATEPTPVRAPPGMPSIAVLPLVNISGDIDQDYFGDGIAGDIITQLSHSNALFVVARKWSFAFRGQTTDLKRILRELGAVHVLGGSVRLDGEQVRINAKLVESATGNQVWAKSFDRAITDLFEVQDAIADGVALAISPDISPIERQRIECKPIVSHRVVVGATASGHSTASAGCA
jgi:adenylate cyclase